MLRKFQIQTGMTKRKVLCLLECDAVQFTGADVSKESNDSVFREMKYAARRKGADTLRSGREFLFYRFNEVLMLIFGYKREKSAGQTSGTFSLTRAGNG